MKVRIQQVTFENDLAPLKVEILYEYRKDEWTVGRYYYADNFKLSVELIKDILTQGGADIEVLPPRLVNITPPHEDPEVEAIHQANISLIKRLNKENLSNEEFLEIETEIQENRKKLKKLNELKGSL